MSSVSLSPGKGHNSMQTERLFQEHGDFLMRILLKSLPEQDALDVFQNLCLKAVTNGFPDDLDDVRPYLYRSAKNAIIDYQRRASTYARKIQEYSEQRPEKTDADPATEVMQSNLLMKAFEMIEEHLTPSMNQVFKKKYQQNLSHREIAKNMNITKSTVDRYLSVGTQQFHALYDELFGAPNE